MKCSISEEKVISQIMQIQDMKGNRNKVDDLNLLKLLLGENVEIPKFDYDRSQVVRAYNHLQDAIQRFELLTYQNLVDVRRLELKTTDLTKEDIITIVHDFFKSRKESIYKNFLYSFDKRNTNLKFTEMVNEGLNPAYSYLIASLKECYIVCEYTGTIFDVTKLAHEYGHATMFLYENCLYKNSAVIYTELDGVYFEVEMIKYLIENNICTRDTIISAMIEHAFMNAAAANLVCHFDFSDLNYLLSYMMSIEIGMASNNDELLEKIINNRPRSVVNSFKMLEKYITLNKNTASYHNDLMTNVKKHVLTR